MAPAAPLAARGPGARTSRWTRRSRYGDVEGAFAEADHVVTRPASTGAGRAVSRSRRSARSRTTTSRRACSRSTRTRSRLTNFHVPAREASGLQANKLNMIPQPARRQLRLEVLGDARQRDSPGCCAKFVGRPVKYVEDRIDNLSSCDHHGSERSYESSSSRSTKDGIFTASRSTCVDDYGAYIQFGVGHARQRDGAGRRLLPRSRRISYRARGVFTNKCQQGAYRGFGSRGAQLRRRAHRRPRGARAGEDPVELRRRNFIRPEQFPLQDPRRQRVRLAATTSAVLDKALEHRRPRRTGAREQERAAQARDATSASASSRARSAASTRRTSGGSSTGKRHVRLERPREHHAQRRRASAASRRPSTRLPSGATAPRRWWPSASPRSSASSPRRDDRLRGNAGQGLPGSGPGGSRFTVMIAGAVQGAAAKIRDKAIKVAAHMLEASPGRPRVRRRRRPGARAARRSASTLAEIAIMPRLFKHQPSGRHRQRLRGGHGLRPPVHDAAHRRPLDLGVFYPMMAHACHIPIVEVDVETGEVDVPRVRRGARLRHGRSTPGRSTGHIVGGLAQGVGQTLLEEYVYDDARAAAHLELLDYLIPSAMEVPEVTIGHEETPSPFTPYGTKGGGEGGRMHAPGGDRVPPSTTRWSRSASVSATCR